MAFVKVDRVGKVTIADRDGFLYLVYTINGKKQRDATGYATTKRMPPPVLSQAKAINDAFAAARAKRTLQALGIDDSHGKPRTPAISFTDAIEQAIAASPGTEYHKANLRAFTRHFEAYIKTISPEARPFFHEIDSSHVIRYIQSKQPAVSNKSLRAYISPILMASRYWVNIDPRRYHRITVDARRYLPLKKKTFKVWTLAQILKVEPIAARTRSDKAMPVLMLGALAGLNIAEMQELMKSDWDSAQGLLTVRQAKNDNRPRIIPVVGKVRRWCDHAFTALPTHGSYLITTSAGDRMPDDDYKNTGRAFDKRVIQPAVALYGDSYRIVPSDCRESLTGLMVAAGVGEDAQRAYIGHAGKDVHASAYADYSKADILREQVIAPLEARYPALR